MTIEKAAMVIARGDRIAVCGKTVAARGIARIRRQPDPKTGED